MSTVADHEAAHVGVASLLDNVDIISCSIAPDEHTAGRSEFDYSEATIRDRALVLLSGMLESGLAPIWPPEGRSTDEANLAGITRELDAASFKQLVAECKALRETSEYKRAHAAISSLLEVDRSLDQEALDRVLTDVAGTVAYEGALDTGEPARRHKALTDYDLCQMLEDVESRALRAHRKAAVVAIKAFAC